MNNKRIDLEVDDECITSSFELTSITFNANNAMSIYRIKYLKPTQNVMQQLTAIELMAQPITPHCVDKTLIRNLIDEVLDKDYSINSSSV